jgi:DNA-binding transcriptional MerR regulator/DNA gyrase inhibitor GyrI
LYSIGEFSKISGLTIKALHLYHEKQLLVPSAVDRDTGYRYYDQHDVEKAHAIFLLKEMKFSLLEIGDLLKDYRDDAEIVGFLEQKKSHIEIQLKQLKLATASLDGVIKAERDAAAMLRKSEEKIQIKDLPPVLVASIRWQGKYSDSGKAFSRLGRAAGMNIAGKPIGLYYDMEYKEDGADIESCFPVRKKLEKDGITCRELPAARCVSLIHQGPYDQLPRSYGRIFKYIKNRNFVPTSPIREVYVKGPGMIFTGNPKRYITEIQIAVAG